MILVDTNVLLDVFLDDPKWSTWSVAALETAYARDDLGINPIIYAEVSIAFARIEELEQVLVEARITVESIPREALFLAGKAFLKYKKRQGSKTNVLPDFFIGAHAAVANMAVLTRDVGRYRAYFPTVEFVTPDSVIPALSEQGQREVGLKISPSKGHALSARAKVRLEGSDGPLDQRRALRKSGCLWKA